MSVTLHEVMGAARARRAPVVGESAGYLVLAVADQVACAPRNVHASDIELSSEGTLRIVRGDAIAEPDAERQCRALLGELMQLSTHGGAALLRAAARAGGGGLAAFVRELEAALVPANRAAARRSLARLCRETERALASGAVHVDPASAPEVAPHAAKPSPATAFVQPIRSESSVHDDLVIDVELEPDGEPAAVLGEASPIGPPASDEFPTVGWTSPSAPPADATPRSESAPAVESGPAGAAGSCESPKQIVAAESTVLFHRKPVIVFDDPRATRDDDDGLDLAPEVEQAPAGDAPAQASSGCSDAVDAAGGSSSFDGSSSSPIDELPIDELPIDELPIDELPIDELPIEVEPVAPASAGQVESIAADPNAGEWTRPEPVIVRAAARARRSDPDPNHTPYLGSLEIEIVANGLLPGGGALVSAPDAPAADDAPDEPTIELPRRPIAASSAERTEETPTEFAECEGVGCVSDLESFDLAEAADADPEVQADADPEVQADADPEVQVDVELECDLSAAPEAAAVAEAMEPETAAAEGDADLVVAPSEPSAEREPEPDAAEVLEAMDPNVDPAPAMIGDSAGEDPFAAEAALDELTLINTAVADLDPCEAHAVDTSGIAETEPATMDSNELVAEIAASIEAPEAECGAEIAASVEAPEAECGSDTGTASSESVDPHAPSNPEPCDASAGDANGASDDPELCIELEAYLLPEPAADCCGVSEPERLAPEPEQIPAPARSEAAAPSDAAAPSGGESAESGADSAAPAWVDRAFTDPMPEAVADIDAEWSEIAAEVAVQQRTPEPTPPPSPPKRPEEANVAVAPAPPRFLPRQSDVGELLSQFRVEQTHTEWELCRELKGLAGVDLTPGAPQAVSSTPPPVAAHVEALSVSPPSGGRRIVPTLTLAVVGICGLFVGARTMAERGSSPSAQAARLHVSEPRRPAPSPALARAHRIDPSVRRPAASEMSDRCRSTLTVDDAPRGAEVRLRSAAPDSALAPRRGVGPVAVFDDVPCAEALEISVVLPSAEGRAWRRIPVARADDSGASGTRNLARRVSAR